MNFATVLDRRYITRAAVMYDSLKFNIPNQQFKLFILSLDEVVFDYFNFFDNVVVIRLSLLEEMFSELKCAKENRSFVEYIFTLSPFLPLYILYTFPTIKRITTIDADLYFFGSPENVIKSLGDDKIGITLHNFHDEINYLISSGKYNVSFQSFPNTIEGISCLKKWGKDCIEYCGDTFDEQGRFADQKYLDNWKSTFSNVMDFPTNSCGLAPWNIKKYKIYWLGNKLLNEDIEVVFYHFHDLRFKSNYHITYGLHKYKTDKPTSSVKRLYLEYCLKLKSKGHIVDTSMVRNNTTINLNLKSIGNDFLQNPIFLIFGKFYFFVDFRKSTQYLFKIYKKIYG